MYASLYQGINVYKKKIIVSYLMYAPFRSLGFSGEGNEGATIF